MEATNYVMCNDLEGHLGEIISVLHMTTGEDEKVIETQFRNPKYVTWKKRNQSLVAYITATYVPKNFEICLPKIIHRY